MSTIPSPGRAGPRRRERGQSALAECAFLLPTYVVLIFACTTFGQMGLLKKKAIMAARYRAFGGSDDTEIEKVLRLDDWKKVSFGQQKVEVQLGATTKITYKPMMIMRKSGSSSENKNPLKIRGGLEESLELSDTYSVDL